MPTDLLLFWERKWSYVCVSYLVTAMMVVLTSLHTIHAAAEQAI